MSKASFVYVTYIRTTSEKLWQALIDPEFNRRYWIGAHQESSWKKGEPWKIVFDDGRMADSGEILDIEPGKRIVIKWRNEFRPDFKAAGFTRCTFDIEPAGDDMMKLSVIHESEADGPNKMIEEGVSKGWPMILSSLKSLLETGQPLPRADKKG
jgi:uncharacterized protein YndB with AHSA1/START domain